MTDYKNNSEDHTHPTDSTNDQYSLNMEQLIEENQKLKTQIDEITGNNSKLTQEMSAITQEFNAFKNKSLSENESMSGLPKDIKVCDFVTFASLLSLRTYKII